MTKSAPPTEEAIPLINRFFPDAKLFFLFNSRRRPFFRGKEGRILKEWTRPTDPAKYQAALHNCGFLTSASIDQAALSPGAQRSLRDLDAVLLPEFFKVDQRAKYYQNVYYRYQWVLAFGAFITGLIATLTLTFSFDKDTLDVGQILAVVTALVAFSSTIISAKDRRQKPQKRWYIWRRTAEELRRLYYLYLTDLMEDDGTGRPREERLQDAVGEIVERGEDDANR
ncbi:MAG: DUF4231 domain-containing protein [Anaerolineae bacterium]|nr:MAG: DUF4231 domain-containing protein [Anaerolineae bacterium]